MQAGRRAARGGAARKCGAVPSRGASGKQRRPRRTGGRKGIREGRMEQEFFTWASLGTYAGAVFATTMITQM